MAWLIVPIILLGPISLILVYYYGFYPGEIPYFNDVRGIIQRLAIGLPFLVVAKIAYSMYKINKEEI